MSEAGQYSGEMTDERTARVNVGYVVVWTTVGVALLVAATALVGGWADAQFWSSVLVNLGTTIFLAGFLVWLERRLVATARTVAREAASTAAAEAATAAAEEATRVLSERLDAIQDRYERRRAERESAEDAAIRSLATEISYDAVLEALTTAHALGAASSPLYATAGTPGVAPVVGVGLVWADNQFDESPPWEVEHLRLSVDTSLLGRAHVVEADWTTSDDPVDVLARIRDEMVRAGYGPESQVLAFDEWFENVRVGLEDGLAGRRGNAGAWRSRGSLLDVISSQWVVSDQGIEHRDHGLVAERELFTRAVVPGSGKAFTQPPAPEWVDDDTWVLVANRARTRLRGREDWRF